MLHRTIARLGLMLTLTLSLAACETSPASEATTPPTETGAADDDAAAADTADLPAASDVLAKSIDAIGGRAAIEAIQSTYTEATTEIKAQGMTVTTKIWTKGDSFYVESDLPGVGMTQVWKKGDDIWSKDPIQGMRKLEGKEADQARWSTDPLLAARWNQYFDEAKTVARSTEGDQELLEVELTKGDQTLTLFFDATSYMPAGQKFVQQTQMGSMPIRVMLTDYREIAGVKVPFTSTSDMNVMTAVQQTDKYEVNVEIDDGKFEPPKQ